MAQLTHTVKNEVGFSASETNILSNHVAETPHSLEDLLKTRAEVCKTKTQLKKILSIPYTGGYLSATLLQKHLSCDATKAALYLRVHGTARAFGSTIYVFR